MLKYDIELFQVDTSGCQDVGSMSSDNFIQRKQNAEVVDYDNFFLYDALRAL